MIVPFFVVYVVCHTNTTLPDLIVRKNTENNENSLRECLFLMIIPFGVVYVYLSMEIVPMNSFFDNYSMFRNRCGWLYLNLTDCDFSCGSELIYHCSTEASILYACRNSGIISLSRQLSSDQPLFTFLRFGFDSVFFMENDSIW